MSATTPPSKTPINPTGNAIPHQQASRSSGAKKVIIKAEGAFSGAADIKRKVRLHLKALGFTKNETGELCPPAGTKEKYRELHRLQRKARLKDEATFIKTRWNDLKRHFADGAEVLPEAISPRMELIESGTWQSELFRLASLTWSVPVSRGYGRRMRFLVWDDYNDKLLGLIGLTDPVFNLKARDHWVGWSAKDRKERLVNVMDAFVLGAMPPYNTLLCGKMLACLLRTSEVRDAFTRRYRFSEGIISKQKKLASLVMVTTSSALGRSAVYNRLKLNGQPYMTSLGFTSGWGHFHLPDGLFSQIRAFLKKHDHRYHDNHQYGDGPSWRLRAIRQAFKMLGLQQGLLRHGLYREVFLSSLAVNAKDLLNGNTITPDYSSLLSCQEVAKLARDRWILPRAHRRPDFHHWTRGSIRELLKQEPKCSNSTISAA